MWDPAVSRPHPSARQKTEEAHATARHTARLAGGGSSGEIDGTGVISVLRGFDWCY